MQAPIEFQNRLSRLFDNRLRIRWSDKRSEWHIEYKVGRGRTPNFFVSSYDDNAIRAKDGYAFLLAIRPGDRMPCPKCHYTIKVPIREFGESRCEYCVLNGKDGRYPAAFFPLEGDSLIQHLSHLDPLKEWRKDLHKTIDKRNQAIMDEKERNFKNYIEAGAKDNFAKLVGIPQFSTSHVNKQDWR